MSVLCDGRRVVHALQAPAALSSFLPGASEPPVDRRERLATHFRLHGDSWPTAIRLDGRVIPVRWKGYAARGTRTEADLVDGRTLVLSHRVVTGIGTRKDHVVREGFWFELRTGTFGLLPRDGGWRAWHRVRRHLAAKGVHPLSESVPGRRATFSVADIEPHGIPTGDDFMSSENGLQLRVDGRQVIPENVIPTLEMSITPPGNPRANALIRGSVVI
ncbi:MAG TPA: hypothetical protein VIU29_05415, partial [Candidatus Deferrimicrobiaceae bacterium]